MAQRARVIDIFVPTNGLKSNLPTITMDPRAQPDGRDAKMYYGCNQKEYGTSLYATGSGSNLGSTINHMSEAKFPGGSVLEVFTSTGVFKYTSGTDSFVSDGQTFTGTETDYWSSVVHNDQFIYNNGVDNMQIKTSVSATGTDMNSAVATNTYKSFSLVSFADHLVLYRTIENGSVKYKRIRWTKKGLLSPSGTDDFTAGTAGAIDVQDCEGEIKTAQHLGPTVAVYSERSIHQQFFISGEEVFRFQKMVSGVGTPSRRGAVSFKNVNYFVGQDNFYAYLGGDDIRPIGDPIKRYAFSRVNNSAMSNAYVEVDHREDEVLFHVPTGSSEFADEVYVFRTADNTWSPPLQRDYASNGGFTRASGLTIGELVGDIGNQNFTFGDAFISVEALTRLYGDRSGRVVKVDPSIYTLSNSGTDSPQNYIFQSPDITAHNAVDPVSRNTVDFSSTNKRWTQLNLELVGNGTADVAYSTNKGNTFTPFPESPLTLVNIGTNHKLDLDISSRYLRIQVSNTATNEFIGLKYYSLEFIPGSEN